MRIPTEFERFEAYADALFDAFAKGRGRFPDRDSFFRQVIFDAPAAGGTPDLETAYFSITSLDQREVKWPGLGNGINYYRAYSSQSKFTVVEEKSRDVHFRVTARLPVGSAAGQKNVPAHQCAEGVGDGFKVGYRRSTRPGKHDPTRDQSG